VAKPMRPQAASNTASFGTEGVSPNKRTPIAMLASGTAVEFNGMSTLRFTPLFTSLAHQTCTDEKTQRAYQRRDRSGETLSQRQHGYSQ
jgi:hypothetical protein